MRFQRNVCIVLLQIRPERERERRRKDCGAEGIGKEMMYSVHTDGGERKGCTVFVQMAGKGNDVQCSYRWRGKEMIYKQCSYRWLGPRYRKGNDVQCSYRWQGK